MTADLTNTPADNHPSWIPDPWKVPVASLAADTSESGVRLATASTAIIAKSWGKSKGGRRNYL